MAALLNLDSMSGIAASLTRELREHKGDGVISAAVHMDHLHDRLEIGVVHVLATRSQLERHGNAFVGARLRQVLGIDRPQEAAKRARVERRQLMARGRDAKVTKPRKAI